MSLIAIFIAEVNCAGNFDPGVVDVVHIDLYADIVCPWCFIGSRRLDTALMSHGQAPEAAIRHRPFMLHPDAPPGGLDLRTMLGRKYGVAPERIFARVESAAREAGISLDLSKQQYTYSTAAAHTLLRHAAARSTQHALVDALFAAYFLDGSNIADAGVLTAVAEKHGFTAREVNGLVHDTHELALTRRDVQEAVGMGIRAVPVFVVNDQRLTGAQPAAVLHAAIANAIERSLGKSDRSAHNHTTDEERVIRDAALDETIASTFPASDPPSTIPNQDDNDAER